MNKDIIAFKYGKLVIENPSSNGRVPILLINFLGSLGRALSPLFIGKISPEEERRILDNLIPWATETYGLDKKWKTVYDSPEVVLRKSDLELRIDQCFLYIEPKVLEVIKKRDGEDNFWTEHNYEITDILLPISDSELSSISEDLISLQRPLSLEQREILKWFTENREYLKLPEVIGMKETLCFLLKNGIDCKLDTANDVLRYMAYCSGYDPEDIYDQGFVLKKSEKRQCRRILRDLVSRKGLIGVASDMYPKRNDWAKATKVLRPRGPLREVFSLVFGKDKSWRTLVLGRQVRDAYDREDPDKVIELFSKRPGEFLRHFDSLIRRFSERSEELISILINSGISIRLLLGLSRYYDRRSITSKNRGYLRKDGSRITYEKAIPDIDPELISEIGLGIREAIKKRYESLPPVENPGKVLISDKFPESLDILLSARTESKDKTQSTIPIYGQKIDLPKSDILRFFLEWVDEFGNKDLDLHAQALSRMGNVVNIGWNTHFKNYGLIHSGDIRHQVGDCAEYINIDMKRARKEFTKIIFTGVDFDNDRLGSSCDTYIGCSKVNLLLDKEWAPKENVTLFREKIRGFNSKAVLLFVVDLEENYMKVITEPYPAFGYANVFNFDYYFSDNSIKFLDLLKLFLESRGFEIIDEVPEDEPYTLIEPKDYNKILKDILI